MIKTIYSSSPLGPSGCQVSMATTGLGHGEPYLYWGALTLRGRSGGKGEEGRGGEGKEAGERREGDRGGAGGWLAEKPSQE